VPPGRYTVKGLSHDGLHALYAGSFASLAIRLGLPRMARVPSTATTPPEAVAFGPGNWRPRLSMAKPVPT